MEIPVIYIFTHDSIGVGEDGPTHQPVEQLASLRAMPGLIDIRPADANEVAEAWRVIMPLRHDPVALVLSRQALPTLDRSRVRVSERAGQGRAYILADPPDGDPEVHPDRDRQRGLASRSARMSSSAPRAFVPAWSACRHGSCSTARIRRTANPCCRRRLRPGSPSSRPPASAGNATWDRPGAVVAMSTFGASAPLKAPAIEVRIHPDAVVRLAEEQLEPAS